MTLSETFSPDSGGRQKTRMPMTIRRTHGKTRLYVKNMGLRRRTIVYVMSTYGSSQHEYFSTFLQQQQQQQQQRTRESPADELPYSYTDRFYARYCDKHVCLSVCLSVCLFASISPELHARSLPNFYVCCLWPWLGPPPVRRRNPNGKGQFWELSSPLSMHCNALAANDIMQQQKVPFGCHPGVMRVHSTGEV